ARVSAWRAAPTRPAPPHCRLPGFLRFRDRSAWCCLSCARSAPVGCCLGVYTSKKPLLRFFLRAVCCSGAPAGAGQFSRASGPAAGGMKRYALRPLAATRPVAAAFVFFFLLPAPLQ